MDSGTDEFGTAEQQATNPHRAKLPPLEGNGRAKMPSTQPHDTWSQGPAAIFAATSPADGNESLSTGLVEPAKTQAVPKLGFKQSSTNRVAPSENASSGNNSLTDGNPSKLKNDKVAHDSSSFHSKMVRVFPLNGLKLQTNQHTAMSLILPLCRNSHVFLWLVTSLTCCNWRTCTQPRSSCRSRIQRKHHYNGLFSTPAQSR